MSVRKSTLIVLNMSAAAKEQIQSFDGVAPGAGARLSTQEVWQSISDMAGQVRALATLHTSLHNALFATLASPVSAALTSLFRL